MVPHVHHVVDSAIADMSATSDRLKGDDGAGYRGEEAHPLADRGLIVARPRTGSIPDKVRDVLDSNTTTLRRQGEVGGRRFTAGCVKSDVVLPAQAAFQPDQSANPDGLLPRVAVTLVAAGFWGYRARFVVGTARRPGRRWAGRAFTGCWS